MGIIGGINIAKPASAATAKGAAELDFEFYLRDLKGGNKRGGTIEPSTPPIVSPPRNLQGPLLPLLLNDDCSPACIPVQALIQQIQQSRPGGDERTIAQDIQNRVQSLRERSTRSFFARTPWKEETVQDQYYFDITAYALWRTAADLLPDYLDRDSFVRKMGSMLLTRLQSDKLVGVIDNKSKDTALVSSIPVAMELLELFKSSQFCKGYRIRGDDMDSEDFVFDELDEESLSTGGTVDALVSIYEPATLGADLQITGEQSRFAPDFVGATLTALWGTANLKVAWVTFFVDPEYRPNPKDYYPNEQLLQYTLSKKT